MDIQGCIDCLMFAANGTVPEDDSGFLDTVEERWDGWRLVPGDDDLGFSWQSCDCCGSRLGGDRFTIHAFH